MKLEHLNVEQTHQVRLKTVTVTIQYGAELPDGTPVEVPDAVFEFDPAHYHLHQDRPVEREHRAGGETHLIPSPYTFTTITGVSKA